MGSIECHEARRLSVQSAVTESKGVYVYAFNPRVILSRSSDPYLVLRGLTKDKKEDADMAVATKLEVGAKVKTSDGKQLGKVQEVSLDCFKVGRRFSSDLWLLNVYVDHVSHGIVVMKMPAQYVWLAESNPPRSAA